MKKYLLIYMLILFSLLLHSKAEITFEKTTHDFGEINE